VLCGRQRREGGGLPGRGLLAIVAAAGVVACAAEGPQQRETPTYVKVFVGKDGGVDLDGQPATLTDVQKALDAAARGGGGAVMYAREAGQEGPHADAMKIMDMIVAKRLPVALSSTKDFSDVIGADGRPRPR
jgi:hypothetical protein